MNHKHQKSIETPAAPSFATPIPYNLPQQYKITLDPPMVTNNHHSYSGFDEADWCIVTFWIWTRIAMMLAFQHYNQPYSGDGPNHLIK